MGKEELLHLYRQLDKECALLSRYQLEEKETQEAFIPDKDNMKKSGNGGRVYADAWPNWRNRTECFPW